MTKTKKITIILIVAIVVLAIIAFVFLSLHKKDKIIPTKEELKPTEYKAVKLEDGSEIINYGTCTSKNADEICYLVVKEAMMTLRNSKVIKEDGEATNIEESINNGLNSAILATYGTIAKIENTKVSTSANGSAAFFVNGTKAEGEINNSTIETLNTFSPAVVATNNAYIKVDHLNASTKVKSSPVVKTLKEKSIIELKNSNLESNGSLSPLVESSGEVKIIDSTGAANASRMADIKNNGKVIIENSSMLVSGGEDDYGSSAVLITSTNKDNNAIFQSINSSLNINQNLPYYKIAPFFIVDNAIAEIDIENTALNFGSNKLLKATNSDIIINLKNQTIYGEIENIDSTIQMNLYENSSYTGAIKDNVSIYLSKDSELNLTGDTNLKELKNDDSTNNNITLNGYHLYVNGELIK